MDVSTLVRMANQIAAYFAPYPKAEAIDAIGKHIHMSWEPRMRNELKAHLDAGGEGLSPLLIEAAQEYFKGPKKPGSRPNVGQLNTGNAPDGLAAKTNNPQPGSTTANRTANTGASPSLTRGT